MQASLALWILKLIRALIWFQKTCTELIWKAYILSKKQGHSDVSVGIDDMDSSSPCSSPGDISSHEKDFTPTSEVMDESETDGKVVRELTQIIALDHISRINGDVPSANKETSDHERLKKRLLQNGFVEHQVKGDGNCQFRALSDQLYGTPEWYNCVRQHVVNQLKSHPERYKGYVPMAYDDYLNRMSKDGVWGDHVTLQAAADVYGVRVLVITSFKDTCFLEILPKKQKSEKVVYLSFWAEVHYNSIHPKGESPHECREEEVEEGVEVPIL